MKPLKFDDKPLYGQDQCGYGLNETDRCTKAGAWHLIFVDGYDLKTVIACEDHVVWIVTQRTTQPEDMHILGPCCNMAGSLWHYSEGDKAGYCYFPQDEVKSKEAAKELVGANG